MKRSDLEKLVRELRTVANRLPQNAMGASERRHVALKLLELTDVGQRVLDNTLTVKE